VGRPEVGRPEIAKPEVGRPEVGRPEVAKQQVAKQQVAKPEVAKPEVAKQQVAKPEVAKPEVAKPEVAKPEVAVKRKHSVIQDVCFRANLPDGNVLSRSVTRLHMTGTWPMTAGRIVSVWVGNGKKNRTAVKLRVNECYEEDGQWVVDCSFVKAPPTELVSRMNKKRLPQPQ
jgi:hypothetical protein